MAGLRSLRWPAVFLTVLAAGCATSLSPLAWRSGPAVESWITTADQTRLLAHNASRSFAQREAQSPRIDVDPSRRRQTIAGFGASITDSSTWLMRHRLSSAHRQALMHEFVGRDDNAIGLSLVRLTLGASHFSRWHYSLEDRPARLTDFELAHFTIDEPRADVIPVLRMALSVNPVQQVIASPWSAPAWMKTSGILIKGTLRPDSRDAYGPHLLRFVDAFTPEGVPIFALKLQNEPRFKPENYPSMYFGPSARAEFVGKHRGPMIARRAMRPHLIEWDHNWDDLQAPLAVLADPLARQHVAGTAWHWYWGEVQAQTVVHDARADKGTWFTDCSRGGWATGGGPNLSWTVRNLVIGAPRHWARGVPMWNLALDENHGPRLGGCTDCRAVVTVDSRSGAVTRTDEHYALAHAFMALERQPARPRTVEPRRS